MLSEGIFYGVGLRFPPKWAVPVALLALFPDRRTGPPGSTRRPDRPSASPTRTRCGKDAAL
jgi:hypothetical protein